MVSNAREDLPDPLKPVITVRVLRGISISMFLRLCWRAPRTEILVKAIDPCSCCPSVIWTGPQKDWRVGFRTSTHVFYWPTAASVNAVGRRGANRGRIANAGLRLRRLGG